MKKTLFTVHCMVLGLLLAGCPTWDVGALFGGSSETGGTGSATATGSGAAATAAGGGALVGVDAMAKVLRIGALNDESGPAAAIGKPYAVGKRILAERVNAGGSGLLPEGWKIELVERDHAYNPTNSIQAYNEIKGEVLFIGTSFGTPNTLPLRPHLERDGLVAFPASLSSKMAEHAFTPPLGPAYSVEAMRAMDWVVSHAGDAATVKAGIVYQHDDYGEDGLTGWKKAAAHHKVEIVAEQTVAPGQTDMTAVVSALKDAGANYVLLTTLPTATGPILGTALKLTYTPVWVGNTPSWVDAFFKPDVVPAALFTNFHWVMGLPYWGEEVPGMADFLKAYEAYGKDKAPPDFYIMASYVQGLIQLEVFNRALTSGDLSRAGYKKALTSLKDYSADGMFQPFDLSALPYVTSTKTRILKPNMETKSWDLVVDYAAPAALGPAAPPHG